MVIKYFIYSSNNCNARNRAFRTGQKRSPKKDNHIDIKSITMSMKMDVNVDVLNSYDQ